jgi:hypothetical protein
MKLLTKHNSIYYDVFKEKNMRNKKWTEQELNILKEKYPMCGSMGLVSEINHTAHAIKNMAKRLGLKILSEARSTLAKAVMAKRPTKRQDLVGKRFGRLVVLQYDHTGLVGNVKLSAAFWLCQCDCGNKVVVQAGNLRGGSTQSCGCLQREKTIERNKNGATHGKSHDRIYRTWQSMLNRCYRVNDKKYPLYGGKGVIVCKEWHDPCQFISWAYANGYTDKLTIDRIDGDGNYCPENCRWVDYKTQNNNRRICHYIEYNGMTKTISEWAEYLGISLYALQHRIKDGWSIERAFTQKVGKQNSKIYD